MIRLSATSPSRSLKQLGALLHLAQRMLPLLGPFRQERQIRRDQRPLFIRHIGRVRLAGSHAPQPDRYQPAGP
jgi:hypothetical protein